LGKFQEVCEAKVCAQALHQEGIDPSTSKVEIM